jgi:hypothetical protein
LRREPRASFALFVVVVAVVVVAAFVVVLIVAPVATGGGIEAGASGGRPSLPLVAKMERVAVTYIY